MKTKHFYHGCPWANGEIQQSDTDQRFDWREVNCQKCLFNKNADGTSRNWKEEDRKKYEICKTYL